MNLRIAFARWRSEVPSGGNRYDDELTAGLRALGIEIHEHAVTGSWPVPEQHDRESFQEMLTAAPDDIESHWLIDNIVAAAVPHLIRGAREAGHRVSMIMHYFASDERGLSPALRSQLAGDEAAAVAAASTVIATSQWTADEVAKRYGRQDVTVAVPGVHLAEISPGSLSLGAPPQLLWLARLTQTKDASTFVAALAELQDLDWTAQLVGPDTIDPALSRSVRTQVADAGLADRVEITGAREGRSLERVWSGTDLLVHTARTEAYGMVVSEALARGIPSIVAAGTGAVEAQQGAGGAFAPGDAEELSEILRGWLTNPQLQRRWRADARARRAVLPAWESAARVVARALAP